MKTFRQLAALSLMADSMLFYCPGYGIHASAEGQSSDKYVICANQTAVHRTLCN